MIASLRGSVAYLTPQLRKDSYVVVDVGGVGYKVFVPSKTIPTLQLQQELTLFTHMSVSDHALDLYGFVSAAEKTFFVLLLSVPGIGPKSALGILDKASLHEVQEAALADDPKHLVEVAGLGLKTAEKIVVALKDKVAALAPVSAAPAKAGTVDSDAVEVLVAFGYTAVEAKAALREVGSEHVQTSERVRAALKQLSRHAS